MQKFHGALRFKSCSCLWLRPVAVYNCVNVLFQTAEGLAESQDVKGENQRSFTRMLDVLNGFQLTGNFISVNAFAK